jgi:hypothetical protein
MVLPPLSILNSPVAIEIDDALRFGLFEQVMETRLAVAPCWNP